MKKYMIIYTSDEYKSIVARIKTFKAYTRVKYRVWCVQTEIEKATDVRDRFDDVRTPGDLLMVIDITNSPWAAANLPTDTVYWLKEK